MVLEAVLFLSFVQRRMRSGDQKGSQNCRGVQSAFLYCSLILAATHSRGAQRTRQQPLTWARPRLSLECDPICNDDPPSRARPPSAPPGSVARSDRALICFSALSDPLHFRSHKHPAKKTLLNAHANGKLGVSCMTGGREYSMYYVGVCAPYPTSCGGNSEAE